MLFLKKPTLIAEIGINHNGSVRLAKKLIDLAKDSGFDYVKFQKRSPEISTPETQKNILRDTPWGLMSYLKYKKKIELSIKQYDEINKYCKKKKIKWFVSCWDIKSFNDMKKYNFDYHKIASAMITNYPLLTEVAKTRTPTIISTGMCTEKDIARAINIFRKHKCKFSLLHCISTYPANEKDLNLNLIKLLKKKFKCPVGYSGHEASVSPTILAYIMGATIIERHITLNRSMWGTDQAASLSNEGIKSLISVINKIPKILGNGKKNFLTEEKKIAKKLRYW
jgi:N-acetylneuraminate synthase